MKTIEEKIKAIDDAVSIQTTPGNFDYSEYMRGMANGLIFAQAVLKDQSPEYIEAPESKSTFQQNLDNYLSSLTKPNKED